MDILYEPLFNIFVSLIFLVLAISFYFDKGTWLMIYYGCAPEKQLQKMNKRLINNICSAVYLFLSLLFAFQIVQLLTGYNFLIIKIDIFALIVFVILHVVTFYLCQIKPNRKRDKHAKK